MDSRAAGAMPLTWPMGEPATVASVGMPAAVLAGCEPWPLRSRGEANSPGRARPAPDWSYHRAPITLLLHVTGSESPVTHSPANFAPMASASGRGSESAPKLGFSGQKPE